MFYDKSFPEVYGNIEESTKERAPSNHIFKPALKWPLMVIALVVAAAIAVGVGVGVWRHREHVLHKSSTVVRCGVRADPICSLAYFHSASAPQSHNITPAAKLILDDTSLVALSLFNGDRQLFFQDNTGRIRRAIRPESNNQWSTSPYLDLSSNPKDYTPMVATAYDDNDNGDQWTGAEVLSRPRKSTVLMLADLYVEFWTTLCFKKPYSYFKSSKSLR